MLKMLRDYKSTTKKGLKSTRAILRFLLPVGDAAPRGGVGRRKFVLCEHNKERTKRKSAGAQTLAKTKETFLEE